MNVIEQHANHFTVFHSMEHNCNAALSILCSVMRGMRTFLSITRGKKRKKKKRKGKKYILRRIRERTATNRKYGLYIDASAAKIRFVTEKRPGKYVGSKQRDITAFE